MNTRQIRLFAGSAIGLLLLLGEAAHAQDAAPVATLPSAPAAQPPSSSTISEVVVTGTLVRGIAPVGSNQMNMSAQDITATGAVTTTELLSNVPAITSNFNSLPKAAIGDWGTTSVRPNIRNLGPTSNQVGSNTTLLLLDGHNMVGAGILATTADQGVIVPGVLERVDVEPDGGSSLYGSDAIGGVVNFITRKKVEGVEVGGHAGFANGYSETEGNITAGHVWGSGSAYVAFDYRRNSDLQVASRSWARQYLPQFGGTDYRSTNCNPGSAVINGAYYSLATGAAGKVVCDTSVNTDLFPAEHQASVFGRLDQDLNDKVNFSVTGYWANRVSTFKQNQDVVSGGAKITNANPFFNAFGTGATSETLFYNYASIYGLSADNVLSLSESGITPTFTFKLPHDWRLVAFYNYGQSDTVSTSPRVNSTAEANALASTNPSLALDPYNLALTNPLVLQQIHAFQQYGEVVQTMHDAKATADGAVFRLPGGDVRVAVGGEFEYYSLNGVGSGGVPIGDLTTALRTNASRTIEAAFGELVVPLVGADNAMTGVKQLTVDISARYDHYSDFGGTTNPKIGVTYKPTNDLSLRGNFGTAFNAPSLVDTSGGVDSRIQVGGVPVTLGPAQYGPYPQAGYSITRAGGNPNLKPQTATTASIGADYKPQWAPGLTLSATYWAVDMKQVIEIYSGANLYANPAALALLYLNSPTLAQLTARAGNVPVVGAPSLAALYASGTPVFQFQDLRRANLGELQVNGMDFNGVYVMGSPVGRLTLNVGGSLLLQRRSNVLGGAWFNELAQNTGPLQLSAGLADKVGDLNARIWVNYSAGYKVTGSGTQVQIGGFYPINLSLAYDLHGKWLDHTTVTLNLDNIADMNPPFQNIAAGYGNGFTLGREIEFGFHHKF
jgi:iron complex outermembrane receptor protein